VSESRTRENRNGGEGDEIGHWEFVRAVFPLTVLDAERTDVCTGKVRGPGDLAEGGEHMVNMATVLV